MFRSVTLLIYIKVLNLGLYYYTIMELEMKVQKTMKRNIILCIQIFTISILSSQDVFEGYTLFTTGGGGQSGSATTYLKDSNWNTINEWDHDCGAASMPYLVLTDESGIENSLLYCLYFYKNFRQKN